MRARRVLPWVWVAVVGTAFLGGLALDLRADLAEGDLNLVGAASGALIALAFPTAGALLLTRYPRNPIGWLLALSGLYMFANGLDSMIDGYVTAPALLWTEWFSQIFFPPSFLTLISLLPLLFPTGRLLSTRWRWALWCAVIGLTGLTLGNALHPDLLEGGRRNPAAGLGSAEFYDGVVFPVAGSFFIIAVVAGLASLVLRYRRAQGDERHQLRWLMLAMIVSVTGWSVAIGLEAVGNQELGGTIFGTTLVALPIAIAVAVLKYRLYDIDVVISRSLVFAGLAGFITAIYVGIVVGVGSLLGAGGEPNLGLSIVATAVVAVAFQPVRERLTRLANRLVFGKRATPYEVLSRFSSHLGDTVATGNTLEKMAQLLADGTGAAHAQVSLLIGGQLAPAASVGQADASADAHDVEVTHQGEALGALSVTKKRGETLTPADVKLVDDLAAQAGLLLRNVRLTEQLKQRIVDLRASRQRLVAAQDQERRRLERDLHDGAQQQIVAMKLKLGIARTLAERENAPKTVTSVEQLTERTDDAVQTLRELAHGIYPPLLAAEGLHAAISTAARRAPVPVTVETDGIGRHPQDIEAAIYFCVLEAITNATKYANPTHVTVTLQKLDGQLTFDVTDDGTGFDPGITPRGHGLTNMTDRLDALNGQLEIKSRNGKGTVVRGVLPVRSQLYETGTNR